MRILIRGGNLHDGKGQVYKKTDLLIEDQKIKAIGKDLACAEAKIIEAEGKEVFPGFIDPMSSWGCAAGRSLAKDSEESSDPITPHLNAYYAFDAENIKFQNIWEYGITAVGVMPADSNILGGMGAVFKSWGESSDQMLVAEQAVLKGSFNEKTKKTYGQRNQAPMTKMGIAAAFKAMLRKAHSEDEKDQVDEKVIAVKKVLNKEVPLMMSCFTAAEIDGVLECLKEENVELIIGGAYGLERKLLNTDCGLILGDLTDGFSIYNRRVNFDMLFNLIDAGKTVALSAFGDTGSPGREILMWNAWELLRRSSLRLRPLNEETLLTMMSSAPAKLLHVDGRIGSLEAGKDADIVIWSANPFITTKAAIEKVFISGQEIKKEAA